MSTRWGARVAGALLLGGLMLVLASARLGAQGNDPEAVVRAYYAALQRGDLKAASACLWKSEGEVPLPPTLQAWGTELFGPPPRSFKDAKLNGCKNNMKNIGTALEMYSTDNAGRYPRSMAKLTPDYLRDIPACPVAKTDTYSATLQVSVKPDGYRFHCSGSHHLDDGLPPNYPRYDSVAGLEAPQGKRRDEAPAWTVASFRILGQRVDGDHGTVQVEETYAVHGFPTRVLADLPVRRVGGRWIVDGRDLLAKGEAKALIDAPTEVLARYLRVRGVALGVAGIFAAVGAPDGVEAMQAKSLDGCRSNLKNIGTALEMYSTDWHGRYPPSMQLLTPGYLARIPPCPGAGKDTYSAGYRQSMKPVDAYTVFCEGAHHKSQGLPANYPQYNSVKGYVEKP